MFNVQAQLMPKASTCALIAAALIVAATTAPAQLAGQQPQVPISHGMWQHLKSDPAALARLGAGLPPVAAVPGPPSAPPARAPAGSAPSVFSPENAPAGSWTNLANTPPGGPYNFGNPLLLTDGTVIVHVTDGVGWWKLTPDNAGSYVNGTWSQIASLPVIDSVQYAPKFFSSAVLPDGRAIVEGGEYNDGASVWTNLGAIYDPIANSWTAVTPPSGWSQIGDAPSVVLADGTMMLADCCDAGNMSALLNATSLSWTATGTGKFDSFTEEAWALLPSGNVLTVDAYAMTGTCGTGTESYNSGTGAWTSAGTVPAILADCNSLSGNGDSNELGPNVLTYAGTVLAFGGTTSTTVASHMAIYGTGGAWSAGTDQPSLCGNGSQSCTMAPAPAAAMPNGNVLLAMSAGLFQTPTNFFEYSPTGNSYAAALATSDAGASSAFYHNFLVLPTGQVLNVSTYNSTIQIYTPSGTFNSNWQPVVTGARGCVAPGASYIVKGNQFNGLTQGAYFGADQQASTNYPLVRIVNNGSGHVFYARTRNHSTMSVAANQAGSTTFKVASATESGASRLYVVANGIPSAGTAVTVSNSCPPGTALTDTHDFNGDGFSDILWRSTGASPTTVAMWLMNGSAISSSGSVAAIPNTYAIIGQRDFTGTGDADLLWRDTSGNLYMWFMNGPTMTASANLGNVPSVWTVMGTGDMNGDGIGDLLWQDSAGDLAIWFMNGSQIASTTSFGTVPPASGWSITWASTGDILWRNTSGELALWQVNDQTVQSTDYGIVPGNWAVQGMGDFNGDGTLDILWRDTGGGTVAIWFLNSNGSVQSTVSIGAVPIATTWTIAETADFNGDGNSDILWIDGSGDLAIWFMNGGAVSSTASLGSVGTTWAVQAQNAE